MHFGNPELLWLILAWLLLVIVAARTLAWRARAAGRIGQPELINRLYPAGIRRWRRRRMILAMAALLFLIIAAARPQYGQIERTMHSVGTNVLVALDCSRSMDAQDVQPSRIEAAKTDLGLMLNRLAGNRIGIVSFAGEAVLQCPMTLDYDMISMVLKNLDTDSVTVPGTNIGEAIDVATNAFERGAPDGGRALVLLTDGEDLAGKAVEAAQRAKGKNVRIYAIGIGTESGAPLLQKAGSGKANTGGFMEDPETGSKVNSRLRMDALRQIASATGGAAYDAGDAPAMAVERVARDIENLRTTDLENRKQVIFQDRFQWFLAPALLLILRMMLLRPKPTRLEENTSLKNRANSSNGNQKPIAPEPATRVR